MLSRGITKSDLYSTISETVPAPTVRPPSRIAKRRPFSMAMGAISSTTICVLSPGMIIPPPPVGEVGRSRHVRGAKVDRRGVAGEERRVAAALLLRQHVDLGLELRVG